MRKTRRGHGLEAIDSISHPTERTEWMDHEVEYQKKKMKKFLTVQEICNVGFTLS